MLMFLQNDKVLVLDSERGTEGDTLHLSVFSSLLSSCYKHLSHAPFLFTGKIKLIPITFIRIYFWTRTINFIWSFISPLQFLWNTVKIFWSPVHVHHNISHQQQLIVIIWNLSSQRDCWQVLLEFSGDLRVSLSLTGRERGHLEVSNSRLPETLNWTIYWLKR